LGFLTSYTNAGKDIGGTAEDVAANKTTGGKDLQIVYWGSGGWFADPAKKAMTDAITSLGPQGFDGAYVENNEMMDGAIQAIQESGLNPSDYWLGSCNGKEKSWQWVRDGLETMDINQTPALGNQTKQRIGYAFVIVIGSVFVKTDDLMFGRGRSSGLGSGCCIRRSCGRRSRRLRGLSRRR
jgi:hypothetical protein